LVGDHITSASRADDFALRQSHAPGIKIAPSKFRLIGRGVFGFGAAW
jgi:hypothetical protein